MRGSLGSEDMLAGSHNYIGLFEGKDVHLKLQLSAWNLLASVLRHVKMLEIKALNYLAVD